MKSKKWLKLSAVILPLILIGIMAYLYHTIQDKKAKLKILQEMPNLSLKTISGDLYSFKNLDNGRNKVLIYFSTKCHYCEAEAEELSKIHLQYSDIEWIWVSSNKLEDIKKFAEQYHLVNIENIKWCHDDMAKLYSTYNMSSVPYFLIYD